MPPQLEGYDYVRALGSGGFADVYLYRQHLPERDVAVKVLRDAAAQRTDQQRFEAEVNRMARLSAHPAILTIYEVGMSPDRRPFLTMEYCPHDHFGVLAGASLSVAQALDVGVKVAGALATAHQAGILHRDIKPANILLTAYRQPALTDFGIAGGREAGELAESEGVSIPYAAPEVLSGATAGDERSDVYSMAATVYALLAGRAPFARRDGRRLGQDEHMHRILHDPLPPLGRDDVPAALERTLRVAMARDPQGRTASAAALGRALQNVEVELGLAQTPLQIPSSPAAPSRHDGEQDDGTRLRRPQRVDPSGAVSHRASARAPSSISDATGSPVAAEVPPPQAVDGDRGSQPDSAPEHGEPAFEDTLARLRPAGEAAEPTPEPAAEEPRTSRRWLMGSVVGGALLIALAMLLGLGASAGTEDDRTTTTFVDDEAFDVVVPPAPPEQVSASRVDADTVAVDWAALERAEDGDEYRVVVTSGPLEGVTTDLDGGPWEADLEQGESLCAVVLTIRGALISGPSEEACA